MLHERALPAQRKPHISVSVRIRPLGKNPSLQPCPVRGTFGSFEFDSVHEASESQEDVYSASVAPVVQTFLQGQNATVLLYGASGTGKTWTLEGPATESDGKQGVIVQAVRTIFQHLDVVPKTRYMLAATYAGLSARPDASMLDLLHPGAVAINLREQGASVALAKLCSVAIESEDDAQQLIRRGRVLRAVAASSVAGPGKRPDAPGRTLHTMFSLHLTVRPGEADSFSHTLTFVDLVSPEVKDVHQWAPGRADEPLLRNLSLSYTSLASVLLALRSQTSQRSPDITHIPWRNSPLTKWLRPPLQCAAVILVVATVAPGVEAAVETLATLNFVTRFRTDGQGGGLLVRPSWESPANSAVSGGVDGCTSPLPSPRLGTLQSAASGGWSSPRSGQNQGLMSTFYVPRDALHGHERPSWGAADSAPGAEPAGDTIRKDSAGAGEVQREAVRGRRGGEEERRSTPRLRSPSPGQVGPGGPGRLSSDHLVAYQELLQGLRCLGGSLREEALLEQLMHAIAEAQAQTGRVASKCDQAEEAAQQLQHMLDSQSADRTTTLAIIEQLQTELQALRLQEQAKEAEADASALVLASEGRHTHGREASPAGSAVVDDLQSRVAELESEASDLKARLDSAETRADAEAFRRQQQEVLREDVRAELDSSAARHEEQLERLRRDLEASERERARLQEAEAGANERVKALLAAAERDALSRRAAGEEHTAVLQQLQAERSAHADTRETVEAMRLALQEHRSREARAQKEAEKRGQRADALQEKILALDDRLADAETRLADAAGNADAARQAEVLRSDCNELSKQLACTNSELAAARADMEAAHSQLTEMHSLHEAVAKELACKVEAVGMMEEELHELRRRTADADTKDARCSEAEQRARDAGEALERMRAELNASKEAERCRSMEVRVNAEAIQRIQRERDEAESAARTAKQALDDASGSAEALRQEVSVRNSLLDHLWADLSLALVNLGKMAPVLGRSGAAAAMGSRGGQLGDLQDWSMHVCQERCMRCMSELKTTAAQLHTEHAELSRMRMSATDLTASLQELEMRYAAQQEELRNTKAQLSDAFFELDAAQQDVQSFRRSLEAERKHSDGLREEMETLTSARNSWKASAAAAEQQLKEVLQEGQGRTRDVAALRAANEQHLVEIERLQADAAEREKAGTEAVSRLEALTVELAEAEEGAEAGRSRVAALEAQVAEAEDQCMRHQAANAQLMQQYEAQVRAAAEQDAVRRGEVEQLRTAVLEAQLRVSTLEADSLDVDGCRAECARLQAQLDEVAREKRQLQVQASHAAEERQQLVAAQEKLRSEVQRLKEAAPGSLAGSDRLQVDAAMLAHKKSLGMSLERLDQARERTRLALERSRSVRRNPSLSPSKAKETLSGIPAER